VTEPLLKGSSLLLTLGEDAPLRLPPIQKQFAKGRAEFFNSGNEVVIRLIPPLRMSYEESEKDEATGGWHVVSG